MRLWHYKILPFLPKSQLLAQWRELNSIYAKQDKHILINFIYEYDKQELLFYSLMVIGELEKRGIKIRTIEKFYDYFRYSSFSNVGSAFDHKPFIHHMNFEYLEICYFNLKEKYIRGQKDFTKEQFLAICKIYENGRCY